jgi:hypothetical protein
METSSSVASETCTASAASNDRITGYAIDGSACAEKEWKMSRKLILMFAVVLTLGSLATATVKPDFSGAWTMDRARSFGLPGNMQQTMTVKQTADQMEVETRLIQPGNERTQKDTYILDGKEYDFAPLAPPNAPANAPAPKGKRTSKWLSDGTGIIAEEAITNETPKGPATTNIIKKWTFTAAGELTIAFFVDGPNGSYEAKRIFTKKK